MNRKAKILGLVLFVAVATAVVTAVSAQAEGEKFTAASYPATISGSGEVELTYGEAGATEICKKESLDGTLKEPSTTLELVPTYEECSITYTGGGGGGGIVTTMNGCAYKETPPVKLTVDIFEIATDLVCPPGKVMEKHAPKECTFTFPAQANMRIDVYEDDTATGKVKLKLSGTAFTYTVDKGLLCPLKAGTFKSGKITGSKTLSASKEGTGISWDVG